MPVEAWMVTAAANAVMVAVYAWIAAMLLRSIVAGRQLRTNPVLTATAAIFVTCTFGHGLHMAHALLPAAFGHGTAHARAMFSDPRLLVWDVFTAAVSVWYWTLRSRFAIIYQGASLCEDMAAREKAAVEMHDQVVQGLTQAKLALDLGHREEGSAAIERTLESSRRIITSLLGAEGTLTELGPGDLRRSRPAGKAG